VLSRDVADTVAALDVLAGYEPGDANWAPPPAAGYGALAAQEPGRLRIGLALNPPLDDAEIHPECVSAARRAAELLTSLGHEVEEVEPPWSGLDLLPDFTRAFGPHVSMVTHMGAGLAGREPTEDDLEPLTWTMWQHARELGVLDYLTAEGRLENVAREIVGFLVGFDVVVTPALGSPPVPTGTIHGGGPDPWANYRRSAQFVPFSAIANVTGQPALCLPLYETDDGLPLAAHLIGPPAREEVLLRLARQLETALPWAQRRPELVGT
jgi:amidase